LQPLEPGARPEDLTDHAQALAWFHAEHAVLLAAVDHAAATGFDTHTWQLAWTLGNFLLRQGHWYDRVQVQQAAVAAADRAGERAGQAQARRNLGDAYSYLGRYDVAEMCLQEALELSGEGANLDRALTHLSLTFLMERQALHSAALQHAVQALDLFQAAGHEAGQANSLNAIGWVCSQLGDHAQALARCEHALALQRRSGDRYGQAETWDSLGYIHHHLGEEREAIACYRHALELFHDLGDRHNEAETLNRLGDTRRALGEEEAARAAWRQALAIFMELDHPQADHLRTKLGPGQATGSPSERKARPSSVTTADS
jgi:tetratricopeptide (TPR) repeat protein